MSLLSDMYEARSQLERIHAVGGGKAAISQALAHGIGRQEATQFLRLVIRDRAGT
jgi:hypothetical protein